MENQPKILIQGENIDKLNQLINAVPYGYIKPIVDLLNMCVIEEPILPTSSDGKSIDKDLQST